MLPAQFEALQTAPSGVGEALDIVAGFDEALVHGLARLTDQHAAALTAMAGALSASPLRDRVAEAADKVVAGSIAPEHLMALAGGRAAILGAVHDALLGQFDAVTGRSRTVWESLATGASARNNVGVGPSGSAGNDASGGQNGSDARGASAGGPSDVDGAAANLWMAAQSWLAELAVTGWRGVGHDLVAASGNVLQGLLADAGSRRLAVLLDGFASELGASCPIATMEEIPVRRWADLWSRAMLLSQSGSWAGAADEEVSGRLLILGVDLHEHETAVQVQVHGVLEGSGPTKLVRTSITSAKVGTITGSGIWKLLSGYPMMVKALSEHRGLEVSGLPLLPSGDLIWHDDRAQLGEPADPFTTARVMLAGAVAPAVPPLDRHHVRIAEPVLVEGHRITDLDRLSASGPITPELVASSSACIGLMRWEDGRWLLQPLAVQATVKKKAVTVHSGDWAAGVEDKKAGDPVAVLRERAGRLLRK